MLKCALVGRPNVGKSSLFNRICQKKIAIVDEQEGTTRDRLYGNGEIHGFPFILIDTGGLDSHSDDPLRKKILASTYKGVEDADTIIMVVDAHSGVTSLDKEIAEFLLQTKKQVVLAVNKIDKEGDELLAHNFYSLGIKKIITVSAMLGYNIQSLTEEAWRGFTLLPAPLGEKKVHRLAIIGRPNAGKSTLINALLKEDRVIESPIAGTTVDAVEIPCTLGHKEYILIDTAGVRRKKKEKELIDKLSTLKRERAIDRADICIMVCSAESGLTQEEKRIVQQIQDAGKGCILAFNKWDLIKGFRMEHCIQALKQEHPLLSDLPLLFISAKEHRNLSPLINTIHEVDESLQRQIPTAALNKCIRRAYESNSPPVVDNKILVIYYITQIEVGPPKFLLFVNHAAHMSPSYRRYLINQLRQEFNLTGVPITLALRGKTAPSPQKALTEKALEALDV